MAGTRVNGCGAAAAVAAAAAAAHRYARLACGITCEGVLIRDPWSAGGTEQRSQF